MCDERLEHIQRVLKDVFELDGLAAGIEACLDAAQIEQIVDECRDILYARLDAFHEFLLLLVERAGPCDQFGVTHYGGQGGTQIMRNGVDEFVFDPVQFL